jgi:hypothetical protein
MLRPMLAKRALLVLALSGCAAAPASFPDDAPVRAANRRWCEALAAAPDRAEGWPLRSACDAFQPAGSAAFVARMAECYRGEREAGAADDGQVVAACTDKVVHALDSKGAAALVDARCRHRERCRGESAHACVEGLRALEPGQRAVLAGMYAARAQHAIAACLDEIDCKKSDEQAYDACYRPEHERRVWLPGAK